jgi:DNA polymerase I-like protein with 3'-5' exonuclease and polymerase domains
MRIESLDLKPQHVVEEIPDDLHEFPIVSLDTETTGLHWWRGDKAFGVAIAAYDGTTMFKGYVDLRERPRFAEHLNEEAKRIKLLVNHNMKFDVHMLRGTGISVSNYDCTSVRAALLNEHEPSFSLDSLSQKYLGMSKVDIYDKLAAIFGGKPTRSAQMPNLHRAPVELAASYAMDDPMLAILLYIYQQKIIADPQMEDMAEVIAMERKLTPVLVDMELQGVKVDPQMAVARMKKIDKIIDKALSDLAKVAGKQVNVNSSPQMKDLFRVRKVDGKWFTDTGYPLPSTETGVASIDATVLRALVDLQDPRAELVYRARKMTKAKSFLKDHILGHNVNGRVHPNYNQTRSETGLGTGTGRLSIDDPAMQQIPARDKEIAEQVRECFIAEEGEQWVCADWEQFEFRWFAHYVNEPRIIDTYQNDPDIDFHGLVGQLTGLPRSARFAGDANAKQLNLGMVFGMGNGLMAAQMGMPFTITIKKFGDQPEREFMEPGPEAREAFAKYHSAIPGVERLLKQASSIARSRGYVRTLLGRRIRFPKGQYHKAAGLVFQGTSADCIKMKMIEHHEAGKQRGYSVILSVHDELDFLVPKDKQSKEKIAKIKSMQEHIPGCRIPIRASVGVGPNWWEASK